MKDLAFSYKKSKINYQLRSSDYGKSCLQNQKVIRKAEKIIMIGLLEGRLNLIKKSVFITLSMGHT